MKFRKKPVVIEAWRWTLSFKEPVTGLWAPNHMPEWMHEALNKWPDTGGLIFEHEHGPRICIATLEGLMTAKLGDWIIKGVKGELYACKPDIFDMTYEAVGDAP